MISHWELIKSSLEKQYINKRILILGFGKEGESTYQLLKQLDCPFHLAVMDNQVSKVQNFLETENDSQTDIRADYLQGLEDYDYIFKTPGLPGYLLEHIDKRKISSQSQVFLSMVGQRCISITGTKGKSTTSSLIHKVLQDLGHEVKLVGNIGLPALDQLTKDDGKCIYVYEMSSFQTEFLNKGPQIGVILNLFEEHLNNYRDYDAYQESKLQLFKADYMEDQLLLYGADNTRLKEKIKGLIATELETKASSIQAFGHLKSNSLNHQGCFLDGHRIVMRKMEKDWLLSEGLNMHLLGEHNLINALVVFSIVDYLYGLNESNLKQVIESIESFEGLPHRIEFIDNVKGIGFYDDSISTIPQACMKDFEAVGNVGSLIIGGYDRGLDYTEFIDFLKGLGDCKIICLPETGHIIYETLIREGISGEVCFKVEDMFEAVELAFNVTQVGQNCLLSPAASSYNMYANFEERGNHFKELVIKHS